MKWKAYHLSRKWTMARGSEERHQRVGDMRRPNDVEQCCDVNTRETSEQAEEAMSEAQLAQQANLALPLTHLGKMHEQMLSQKSQPQDTSTTTAVPPQIPPETCQGQIVAGGPVVTLAGSSTLIQLSSTSSIPSQYLWPPFSFAWPP